MTLFCELLGERRKKVNLYIKAPNVQAGDSNVIYYRDQTLFFMH